MIVRAEAMALRMTDVRKAGLPRGFELAFVIIHIDGMMAPRRAAGTVEC